MRLLITGAWQDGWNRCVEIKDLGHEVQFMENESAPLPCAPEWVEGVICNSFFLYHDSEEMVNLRYIQLTSAGFDRLPLKLIENPNIEIHNAIGVYSIPMAEYAVSGVLQIYKQTAFFYSKKKQHVWEKHRGLRELNGKTVCIIGCGNVGIECAKRFTAFGCDVIGVNRTIKESPYFSMIYPLGEIDIALQQCNILVITIALTEMTRHLINAERLALLKDNTVLVNISRGAVVDTEALIAWLKANPAFYAVLDVFEEEPLSASSPLWDLENVVLTPHNSFVGNGNNARLWELINNFLI